MLWIIYAEDKDGGAPIREATKPAHFAYLDAHAGELVLGGALLADEGGQRLGSCLIVNLPDRAAAETWSRDEPFRQAGLFKTVKITRMRKGQFNAAALPHTAEGD